MSASFVIEPVAYDEVIIHEAVHHLQTPIGTARYGRGDWEGEWRIELFSPWLMLEGTIKVLLRGWVTHHRDDVARAWGDDQ